MPPKPPNDTTSLEATRDHLLWRLMQGRPVLRELRDVQRKIDRLKLKAAREEIGVKHAAR